MSSTFDNNDEQLSADDINICKAAGMQGAIVGLQYPNAPYAPGVAHQQLDALITAGVPIYAVYAESQSISDTWKNVEQFKAHIPRIYIACEEAYVDRMFIDNSLNFADSLGLAKTGIYTGGWFWNSSKEYEHWFGDRPLWVAEYDGNPDISRYTKIGDWDAPAIKQWSGNARVGRLNLDLNVTRDWS